MFEILKYVTVGLGCVSSFCSYGLAAYFFRSNKSISKSVAYVFLAEAIGLTIAVLFSIGAGVFDFITPGQRMALSWVMFITATASSLHMARSIEKILRQVND